MAAAASNRTHNAAVLEELRKGDLIEFSRGAYSHWAVYIGGEEVIHLAGDENDGVNANVDSVHLFTICGRRFNKAFVRCENFWNVVLDSKAKINNGKDRKLNPLDRDEIVERAMSKLGEIGYNVLWKNCEHFVSWCRYGEEWSEQANTFLGVAAVGIGALLAGMATLALSSRQEKRDSRRTS